MSPAATETHAELERRRGWSEPTSCGGRMVVVEQGEKFWTIECDQCGFEAGVPVAHMDPGLHAAQLVERRRSSSGIPPRLRGLSLPDDGSALASALRAWARGDAEHPALTLCGECGVGKTYAAAAAAWERARFGPVRWIYVPQLFGRLALAFGDEERHEALRVLDGSEALVLDDIDKSPPKQFAGLELLHAIEMRLTAGSPVLVTTNLMPSELADRYPDSGHPIVSRLRGDGETFMLRGPDRRLERFAV